MTKLGDMSLDDGEFHCPVHGGMLDPNEYDTVVYRDIVDGYWLLGEKRPPDEKLLPGDRRPARINKVLPFCDISAAFAVDHNGSIRRHRVKRMYDIGALEPSKVKEFYLRWRDHEECIVFNVEDPDSGEYVGTVLTKASKRGNDVYRRRVRARFDTLKQFDELNFEDLYRKSSCFKHDGHTPMIFITGTVAAVNDVTRGQWEQFTLDDAWKRMPVELNKFLLRLKRVFGPYAMIRSFEAHESGMPHFNLILCFKNKVFGYCRKPRKKDGKMVCRVDNDDFARIKYRDPKSKKGKNWSMGNIDVQAIEHFNGAKSELAKYIVKDIFSVKGELTCAMCWLYNRRQFAIGSDFVETVFGIKDHELSGSFNDINSESRIINEDAGVASVNSYMHNSTNKDGHEYIFRLVGVLSRAVLHRIKDDLPPDPTVFVKFTAEERSELDYRLMLTMPEKGRTKFDLDESDMIQCNLMRNEEAYRL